MNSYQFVTEQHRLYDTNPVTGEGWLNMSWSRLCKMDIGIPFVVPTLRYLLPGPADAALRLHWQVLKNAFPARPRWHWYPLLLTQVIIWFGAIAWWRLYKVIRHYPMTDISGYGITVIRQLTDLLYLALVCGVDPRSYYAFRLYVWPKKHWMDFVYPQETMNWHAVLSCKPGSPSAALLRDKHAFSLYLTTKGMPCVKTLQYLPTGQKIVLGELPGTETLFLKPNNGSAMRGCAELTCHHPQQAYRFRSVDPREPFDLTSNQEIERTVNRLVAGESYIVQTLLQNSSDIAAMFTTDDLVTLRIISAWIDGRISLVSATAEVHSANEGWTFFSINPITGCIETIAPVLQVSSGKNHSTVCKMAIPQWPEVCALVVRVHTGLADLLTVGWDLAITESGPCIIEGNTSWNIETMQTSSGTPALRTDLLKAYKSAD